MPGLNGMSLGRYRLFERLGSGGMGEVYLAVQSGLGSYQKPLALKLLHPALAEEPGAVEMFLHEANVAARMSHSHVVHVFDVGEEAGYYYLAMELVHGVALDELIRALGSRGAMLPEPVVSWVGRALCEGLQHAHEQGGTGDSRGIVHRDVTPHNVLISSDGEVKLADFGIAKVRQAGGVRSSVFRGKPVFAPPEQIRGELLDARADVYGAAMTLYALATLQTPFDRPTTVEAMEAVLEQPLPDPRAFRSELSPQLSAALLTGAAKDPAARFPSARALRDALPRIVESEAREELARWVKDACREPLLALAHKTEQIRSLPGGATAEASSQAAPPRPSPRRRAVAGALVAAGALAAAAAALALVPARPQPVAPPPPAPSAALPALEPAPAEAPAPEPPPEPAHHAAAPKPRLAYLNIDASPWASVTVNGKAIGTTPIGQYPVPSGSVEVTLANPSLGKQVTKRLKVAPGERAFLKEDLR